MRWFYLSASVAVGAFIAILGQNKLGISPVAVAGIRMEVVSLAGDVKEALTRVREEAEEAKKEIPREKERINDSIIAQELRGAKVKEEDQDRLSSIYAEILTFFRKYGGTTRHWVQHCDMGSGPTSCNYITYLDDPEKLSKREQKFGTILQVHLTKLSHGETTKEYWEVTDITIGVGGSLGREPGANEIQKVAEAYPMLKQMNGQNIKKHLEGFLGNPYKKVLVKIDEIPDTSGQVYITFGKIRHVGSGWRFGHNKELDLVAA